jgi:hypothetical protein
MPDSSAEDEVRRGHSRIPHAGYADNPGVLRLPLRRGPLSWNTESLFSPRGMIGLQR